MAYNSPKNIRPFKTILFVIALLWVVLLVSWAIPAITQFGIKPRTLEGVLGIFVAPLLHGNIAHLTANSLALFVLGLIFIGVEKARAAYIIVPIYLLSGLGTWAIGRAGTVHIGASGIIYGLFGYLIFIGIFRKSAKLILLSLALLAVYGGMLWGVLPLIGNPLISWEGHLSGLLSGSTHFLQIICTSLIQACRR
jgi:membrane associated rhomboid family serine protease